MSHLDVHVQKIQLDWRASYRGVSICGRISSIHKRNAKRGPLSHWRFTRARPVYSPETDHGIITARSQMVAHAHLETEKTCMAVLELSRIGH